MFDEISLRPLTPANWEECIHLQVREDQRGFVAANTYSLAEAYIYPECAPRAIYAGEQMVGFLMYGFDADLQQHWIIRFMIDARFQRRGYGRAALRAVVAEMRRLPGCERIYLSYEPENQGAEQLYAAYGFAPTGEIIEGEKVACLDLAKTP
jgi:diamine N-acetyltransferase